MEKSFIMKATGIVRRIDDFGRIVIPLDIRKQIYSGKDGAGNQVKILYEPDKQCILLIPLSENNN